MSDASIESDAGCDRGCMFGLEATCVVYLQMTLLLNRKWFECCALLFQHTGRIR